MTSQDIDLPAREKMQKRERAMSEALEAPGVHEEPAPTSAANDPTASPSPQIVAANQAALKNLLSPDATTRRAARTTLASQLDPTTQKSLLGYINDPGAEYRAKLGSIIALRNSSANVALSNDDIDLWSR
jgi:hypothetical protein